MGLLEEESQVTGHPAVDAALRSLAGLEGQPVEEHVTVYETVQAALRGVLDEPLQGARDGAPS